MISQNDKTILCRSWVARFYFPIFLCVAITIYVMQQWGQILPSWANNYVNDFLCMPIVLFVCQYVVRELKSNKARLPWSLVFMVTLLYSIYFEYYLPKVDPRYTADFLDVLLYFMGAGFFCIMETSDHSGTWKKPSHL